MYFRLALRDNPIAEVADQGLRHDSEYWQKCWIPLMDPWAGRLVERVADIAGRQGDVHLSMDQLARSLNPQLTDPTAQRDVLRHAATPIEQSGLGSVRRINNDLASITVYRHVPVLTDETLLRLTDHELTDNARMLDEVNKRRVTAGHAPHQLPDWAAERLGRLDQTIQVGSPNTAPPLRTPYTATAGPEQNQAEPPPAEPEPGGGPPAPQPPEGTPPDEPHVRAEPNDPDQAQHRTGERSDRESIRSRAEDKLAQLRQNDPAAPGVAL
jgi:hypothetical protein